MTGQCAMRSSKESIRRDILAYLARNPEAGDTLDGIADWWLRLQRIVDVKSDVKEVVDQLVSEKLILAHQAPDGRVHYRANPERKEGDENKPAR